MENNNNVTNCERFHSLYSSGNNESTEPFTSNMYNRRVLAGEFTVVNKYLLKELVEKGLWTPEVRANLPYPIRNQNFLTGFACACPQFSI